MLEILEIHPKSLQTLPNFPLHPKCQKKIFKSSKSTQNPSKLSHIPQNTTETSRLLLNQLHLLEFWYLGAQWRGIPPEFPETSCKLRATSCNFVRWPVLHEIICKNSCFGPPNFVQTFVQLRATSCKRAWVPVSRFVAKSPVPSLPDTPKAHQMASFMPELSKIMPTNNWLSGF